jgi:hypothetical protein
MGSPSVGDYIALTWKKSDNSIWEGTEGFVLGTFQDNKRPQYLVIDRSTYDLSLKSVFYSLGLLDLFVVDTSEIESILELNQRERPPGTRETMRLKMEIDYKSNVDYEATKTKLQDRDDCFVEINQPIQTDGSSTFTVKHINSIENTTINFSPKGNVQIHCLPKQLNQCLAWLEKAIEIQLGHKHLVLIPTNFMLNIHDIFKENAEPTEELIDRLAIIEGNQTVIFPLGWVNHFFNDLDFNPLEDLFPESQSIEEKVFKNNKKRSSSNEEENKPLDQRILYLNLGFPIGTYVSLKNPLSAEPPLLKLEGLILKQEDENGLKNVWFRSRFDVWQNLHLGSYGNFDGKALIRNLIIDKKNGNYEVSFRKYYGTDFQK